MRSLRSVGIAIATVLSSAVGIGATTLLTTAPASAAPVHNCVSSQIKVSHGPAQGTAGTTYYAIVFTNKGAACALWGVPTIQPVKGAAHHAVGPMARSLSMGMMPVRQVVAKGHSVSVAIGVTDTGNYTPSACVAAKADGILVALGSFVHSTYVHLPISVCTKLTSVTTKLIVPGMTGL